MYIFQDIGSYSPLFLGVSLFEKETFNDMISIFLPDFFLYS